MASLVAARNARMCRGARMVTKCAFQPTTTNTTANVQRRTVFGAAGLIPLLFSAPSALALLLDEDDEELVEKAKANRKAKLKSQKQVARQYIEESGLKDRSFEADLVPIQKAVNKLAESGSQLESGNLTSVSAALNDSWVNDFKSAAAKFPAAESSAEAVFTQLDSFKAAASQADLKGSKQQFVSLVGALQTWATQAGVAYKLQGL